MHKKPNIFITRKIPDHIVDPYKDDFNFSMWQEEKLPVPRDVLLKEVAEADGLLTMVSDPIDEEVICAGNRLKVIANFAVGYDNIDVTFAKERDIVVTNTPDVLTESTADLGFSLLMAAARRIVESAEYVKEDKWQSWAPYMFAGSDIYRKKIGVVGMGRIGQAIARRAKGFNMSIAYHNRSRHEDAERELDATYVSFEELIKASDFIVSVVPYTKETEKIFNEQTFKQMKKEAIFINISRGQVVDEEALYYALKNGDIRAAGLDVFETEPIRADHPLLTLNNAVCTPHIGSASESTRTNMLHLCMRNLKGVLLEKGAETPV